MEYLAGTLCGSHFSLSTSWQIPIVSQKYLNVRIIFPLCTLGTRCPFGGLDHHLLSFSPAFNRQKQKPAGDDVSFQCNIITQRKKKNWRALSPTTVCSPAFCSSPVPVIFQSKRWKEFYYNIQFLCCSLSSLQCKRVSSTVLGPRQKNNRNTIRNSTVVGVWVPRDRSTTTTTGDAINFEKRQ